MERIGNARIFFLGFDTYIEEINEASQVTLQRLVPFQDLFVPSSKNLKAIRVTHILPQFDTLSSVIKIPEQIGCQECAGSNEAGRRCVQKKPLKASVRWTASFRRGRSMSAVIQNLRGVDDENGGPIKVNPSGNLLKGRWMRPDRKLHKLQRKQLPRNCQLLSRRVKRSFLPKENGGPSILRLDKLRRALFERKAKPSLGLR
jgi:hypothetical protein